MSNGEPTPDRDPQSWPALFYRAGVWFVGVAHRNRKHITWFATCVASIVLTWLATRAGVQPPPLPMPIDPGHVAIERGDLAGWHPDPEAVRQVVAALPIKTFSATPAGAVAEADIPKSVYLWDAWRKVNGPRGPPEKNQGNVGSCVSFGTVTAIERTIAAAIANGKPETWKRLCEEVVYGGSRVEIGGGRIRGDGSVGAWAAKFVHDYGVVSREQHGQFDLTTYSESRAREFGRTGVPAALEGVAKEHPVQSYTQVQSWSEAKKALASGYGIAICSDQGFAMTRDSRGVCQARGSWAHCMALDGYHVDADGREYGHIENSWGPDAHTGPVGWGNPTTAGFWAESRVIDRMLRQGDSWAFSDVKGFPARKLDWFTDRRQPERRDALRAVFALAP